MSEDSELGELRAEVHQLRREVATMQHLMGLLPGDGEPAGTGGENAPNGGAHAEIEGDTYLWSGHASVAEVHESMERILDREDGKLPFADETG